ncbi:MAG TPA: M1 family aminopeptidase [Thermoanaerobaculia bacterium]|nr:M1 family aminopeptidase [Thermoanaerobaculia bacterium]
MTRRCAIVVSFAACFALPALGQGPDPSALLAEIDATTLSGAPRVVTRLSLAAGPLTLKLEKGTIFPASTVAGRTAEFVFLGQGRVVMEPPDAIEAGQLDHFTGKKGLDRPIVSAVFAIALDAAADAIAKRPVASPSSEEAAKAGELYGEWKKGTERRLLDVDLGLLRDGLGDPVFQGFFAGLFVDAEGEKLLYYLDPEDQEQVKLGKFVRPELTKKEEKRAERLIHREQRKGRLIGLTLDDLGQWDTWVSSSLARASGERAPGYSRLEPLRYVLDLSLSGRELEASGRARIELEAVAANARFLGLKMHSDLVASAVTDGDGKPLFFRQRLGRIFVALDRALAASETTTIEVAYSGRLFEKVEIGDFALADSFDWYPHTGTVDRARYEVTLHWPDRLELAAGGKLIGSGKEGGQRWERRSIEHAAAGFGFEVGRFTWETRQVGHVKVRVALSPIAYAEQKRYRDYLLDACEQALPFFEETFGPYPFDELTLATTARLYSQSLPGFLSLSREMVSETTGLWGLLVGYEDPRTVIAHELAHQWWGHAVGWESYRDQWLSEAMANYAAVLFAREKLNNTLRFGVGPTSGWQSDLSWPTPSGKPVEWVGPLVLGARLDSSEAGGVYTPVVYKKGAVVLDTLARQLGEDTFRKALREVVRVVDHRPVSTPAFFDLLERLTGQELDLFVRQFVTGVGMPEVHYDYRFERAEDGQWHVRGQAQQLMPFDVRFQVVERANGGLDVARVRELVREEPAFELYAPFEIAVFDSDAEKSGKKKREKLDPKEVGNTRILGRVRLVGPLTEFDIGVADEPKEFWLDGRRQVFGRFFNQKRTPKRALVNRAGDLVFADAPEAEEICRQALAAKPFDGPIYEDTANEKELAEEARVADARLHLLLARLALDGERLDAAEAELAAAARLIDKANADWLEDSLLVARARLAWKRNQPEQTFTLLAAAVLEKETLDSAEGLLLLALAAHYTGRKSELERTLEKAKDGDADFSVLEAKRAAAEKAQLGGSP